MLISIVTPAYNAVKFLPELFETILGQSYVDWEWLIVDDGSADSTYQDALKLASMDSRIRAFTQSNAGQGAARNLGIAAAKGDWIAFLDSDDLWHNEKLALQVSEITKSQPDLVYTAMWVFQEKPSSLAIEPKTWSKPTTEGVVEGKEFLRRVLTLDRREVARISSTIARKALLDEVGGFNEEDRFRAVEDFELWTKLGALGVKGVGIDRPLTFYREVMGSSSDDRAATSRVTMMEIYRRFLEDPAVSSVAQAQIHRATRKQILHFACNGEISSLKKLSHDFSVVEPKDIVPKILLLLPKWLSSLAGKSINYFFSIRKRFRHRI